MTDTTLATIGLGLLVLTNAGSLAWAVRQTLSADRWEAAARRASASANAWRARALAAPRQPVLTQVLPSAAAIDPEEFRRTQLRRIG